MGFSINSHDKKSDKGTQSPLLKIFKEIMMREKNDSEKKNLLPNHQEQNEDRKRKYYNARNKIDRKSNGSVSSEQRKTNTFIGSTAVSRVGKNDQENYSQFQTENKDSWLNWRSKNQKPLPPEPDEETCSCASCALRRLVNSEYAYIVCLLLIFVLSIVAACVLVFKNVPVVSTQSTDKPDVFDIEDIGSADSERLKRKIDISEIGEKDEMHEGVFGKPQYADIFKQDAMNKPVSSDIDFGSSFRELSGLDDEESRNEDDMELANFLEPEKLEVQANEKLREFYKKLVETDAKIKNLRKINDPDTILKNNNYEIKSPDRFRRSLKLYSYPRKFIRHRRGLYNKSNINDNKQTNWKRSKRFNNSTANKPTGFVIENKKLIVEYQPAAKKKVPKCSHNPKESNHHENELKHPFYQNTQRLDELLDNFFNKNLPEIMADPFSLDVLFEQHKNKCKHPNIKENMHINIDQKHKSKTKDGNIKTSDINSDLKEDKSINDDKSPKAYLNLVETMDQKAITIYTPANVQNLIPTEPTTNYEQKLYNDEAKMMAKEKHNVMTAGTTEFQVLLSVSTLMSGNRVTAVPLIDRVPQIRRLMQADEEEESLGYDDFKEVLTDNMENQDDVDRRADRKKRDEEKADKVPVASLQDETFQHAVPIETAPKIVKSNPPGVHNPNWKGPMPLYPDELNSMVRHAAMSANKLDKLPPANDLDIDMKSEVREKKKASDFDYIEDYLDDRYDRLVEMAQAYSDYGVLEGKKDSPRNEKNQATENISPSVRIKLSANFLTRGLLGRIKGTATTPVNLSVKGNLANLVNEQNAAISRNFYNTDQSSEGFRIEIRPTAETRDDILHFTKVLQSHFQVNPDKEASNALRPPHTTELMFNSKAYTNLLEHSHKTIQPSKDDNDYISNDIIFAIHKGRALLSKDNVEPGNYVDYKIMYDDEINNNTIQNNRYDNQNHDMIVYQILDHINGKQITNMHQNNKDKDKQISPDISDIVLEKFPKTKNYNHELEKAGKQMLVFNIPNIHREMAFKTVSPINVNSSGKLFKSTASINENQVANMTMYFNSDYNNLTVDQISEKPMLERVVDLASETLDFNDSNIKHESTQFSNSDQTHYVSFIEDYGATEGITETPIHNDRNINNIINKNQQLLSRRNKKKTLDHEKNPPILKGNIDLKNYNKVFHDEETTNTSDKNIIASKNNTSNNMDIGIYFTMISKWIHGRKGDKVHENNTSSPAGSDLAKIFNKFTNTTNKPKKDVKSTTDVDNSRMFEDKRNIGYKSRVLMVINDDNSTDDEGKSVKEYIDVTGVKSMNVSGNESNKTATSTIATNMMVKNQITMPLKAGHTTVPNLSKKYKRFGRKVKRNADNSNLIFWNDIYDDEYGVQTNSLDNVNIGDKNSRRRNDFIKRSGTWVQEKIRQIAENLKGRDQEVNIRKRLTRDTVGNIGLGQYPKYLFNKILKRDSTVQNNYESDQKAMFGTLGANLALVCKKAAKAVQHLRNIEVKEDSKQGTIATSLMQQLVGLLTDIVDYQVQQKTCTKLPPDLQKYLEWLTLPEYDTRNVKMPELDSSDLRITQTYPTTSFYVGEESKMSEPNQFLETTLSYEKDDQRMSYLDTLKSVEDLMEEYRMMNDEDKSKMTGVKYYLENQLNYLKDGIGSNLYNYGNNNLYFRYKRNHPSIRKRKLHKFIKNFGKKHTRTTAGYYDGIAITEMKKIQERLDPERKLLPKRLYEVSKDVKRNLKDVYYHALAEAKKYTKEGLKTGNTADFSTTQSIKRHSYDRDINRVVKEKLNRGKGS